MRIELTDEPVDVYAVTGFTGQIDIQNIATTPCRLSTNGTLATPKNAYNILAGDPNGQNNWAPFDCNTLMAYGYGAVLIVNDLS